MKKDIEKFIKDEIKYSKIGDLIIKYQYTVYSPSYDENDMVFQDPQTIELKFIDNFETTKYISLSGRNLLPNIMKMKYLIDEIFDEWLKQTNFENFVKYSERQN